MARLEISGISKRYAEREVLAPLSLDVASGEFVVLLGPSGCGKSTLLRIVAGLIEASSGELRLDGRRLDDLPPSERDVAMVFQNYALYPHMSVRENIAFPLKIARRPAAEVAQRVDETARRLGLQELLERRPSALSGGQMQRVALGRALVRRPRLFLFDEPLSNLDVKLRDELRREIARLHRQERTTTLYVTHDQIEALTLAERVVVLEGGRCHQVGTPSEVFERPATRFVAGFVGSPPMNLVLLRARSGSVQLATGSELRAPIEAGEVWLGVRAHHVRLRDDRTEGAVTYVEVLGEHALVHVDLGEHSVEVRVPVERAVPAGARVGVELDPAALHWFDARDGRRIGAT
jgi:sn-glycerol 3-phosphate transport system ATP-binding protein